MSQEQQSGIIQHITFEQDTVWLRQQHQFAKGLELLDDYDHEQLDANGLNKRPAIYPEWNTINRSSMR